MAGDEEGLGDGPHRDAPEGSRGAESVYGDEPEPFVSQALEPLGKRMFPVVTSLPDYPKRSFRRDLVAGITVASLALPAGMAYAELAGLPPVNGLYALLLPAVLYTVFGSSRQIVVGPEGTLSILVAAGLAPLALGNPEQYAAMAAALAVLVAVLAALARALRLGWIADYFSRAVLVGYLHGIAVVLIVNQLGKLFGLNIEGAQSIQKLVDFAGDVSDTHGPTAVVGAISLVVLLLVRRFVPKAPAPLVLVVGGIIASVSLDLAAHGVGVVGHIQPGLPHLEVPKVSIDDLVTLLPTALAIFMVGYVDLVLTARSFAGRHGQHVDANQELIAFGTANLAAGLTQSMPIGSSSSRTAVNDQMHGRTQRVGLVSAAVIAIVVVFFTRPVEYLPSACLGAVIVGAAIGLIDLDAWRVLRLAGRLQFWIAAVTTIGVITLGVLWALVIAVILSLIDVIARSSRPHDAVLGWVPKLDRYGDITMHPSARVNPGIVVYRLDDRLFFGNASYFRARVREAIIGVTTPTDWLVFDAGSVNEIDASGVEAVQELVADLARDHITFVVARAKSHLTERFETTGLTRLIGPENFHGTVSAAVAACLAEAEPDPPG